MSLSTLIAALIAVESSGNDHAVGDHGQALGPLQIRREVVEDVNRITGARHRWEDMTNRAEARQVCEVYLQHYARGKTLEATARTWNGGPAGDRKAATVKYWHKVRKQLNRNTNQRRTK